MARLQDLNPGDILIGTMRIGFALQTVIDGKGHPSRIVPIRACSARLGDIQSFVGWFQSYDPNTGFLTLETQPYTQGLGTGAFNIWGSGYPTQIYFRYIKRLRRVSQHAIQPPVEDPGYTTELAKPYRTVEEVTLR